MLVALTWSGTSWSGSGERHRREGRGQVDRCPGSPGRAPRMGIEHGRCPVGPCSDGVACRGRSRAGGSIPSFLGEERGQEIPARRGGDATGDLELVVEPGVRAEVVERAAGPSPGVAGAEDDPAHSACDQGSRAHGAGLERDDQCHCMEPPSADGDGGIAQGQDLGVRRRIGLDLSLVVAGRHDPPIDEGDGADRDFSLVGGQPGLGQGELHGVLVAQRFGRVSRCHGPSMGGRDPGSVRAAGPRNRLLKRRGMEFPEQVGEGRLELGGVAEERLEVGAELEGRQSVDGAQELLVLCDLHHGAEGSRPGRLRHRRIGQG